MINTYSVVLAILFIANIASAQYNVVLGEIKTTYAFKGEKSSRAHNIELAASKINNTIVNPNELFSFNDIVGPRTKRNGFREAPVIISGDLVEGLGGGVCQVSGTLHASMYLAGMELVEATQHSRKSTYIDAGLDATVFYGSKDLIIRNTYPFPVKIVINNYRESKRGQLDIKIMGAYKVFDIEYETKIYFESKIKVRRIVNKFMKKGQYKLIEKGTPKMDLLRIRRIYKKKSLIAYEEKRIHYEHSTRIIEVPAT